MACTDSTESFVFYNCLCRSTNYTHHQKSVILDTLTEGDDGFRRVTAYMGGIDLTSGRYDDAEHHLFSTLATVHSADFYQNTIAGAGQEFRGLQLGGQGLGRMRQGVGTRWAARNLIRTP